MMELSTKVGPRGVHTGPVTQGGTSSMSADKRSTGVGILQDNLEDVNRVRAELGLRPLSPRRVAHDRSLADPGRAKASSDSFQPTEGEPIGRAYRQLKTALALSITDPYPGDTLAK